MTSELADRSISIVLAKLRSSSVARARVKIRFLPKVFAVSIISTNRAYLTRYRYRISTSNEIAYPNKSQQRLASNVVGGFRV